MAEDAQYPPKYFLPRGRQPRQPEDFNDRGERTFREHWNFPFFRYCWDEGFTRLPTVEDCPECATCHTSRGMPSVFSWLGRQAPSPPQEPINDDDYHEECCQPRWCPDGLSQTQKRRVQHLRTLEQVEEEYLRLL